MGAKSRLSKLFCAVLGNIMVVLDDLERRRYLQRILSVATVLALLLQMVPLGLPAPSKVVTSLFDKAPPPLDTLDPIAEKVTAPFDALAAPFSSSPPLAYAAPVSPSGYITITKSSPATTYQQWDMDNNQVEIDFTYEMTVTNQTDNSIPSFSMRITTTLPTGVPNWEKSGGGTGSNWLLSATGDSPVRFINEGDIPTGSSYVGYYTLYILQPVPDRTVVTDTQTLFLYNGSQYTETHTYTTTVRAPAYGVSITPSQGATVCAGDLVTYTITVSNAGGAPMNAANPFSVTAELPTNVITHSTDGGISQGNWVSWTYPALTSVGAAVSRTLVVSPTGVWNHGDPIVITATALANAEVTPTVGTSNTVTVDRLTAEFTTTPGITVSVSSVVTFTDTYTDPASTIHAWEFGDGVTTTTTGPTSVVTHTYSSVDTYVVTQTVSNSCPGDIFTQTIYVIEPDLHIQKVDAPDPVSAGQPLTYTIYYSNTSLVAATGVVITDVLPTDIITGTATPSQDGGIIGPGNVITWDIGTLDAGELVSITLAVDVDSPLDNGTVLTNTAGITCSVGVYTTTGPVTSTVVSTPTLRIAKTDAPDPVNAGNVLTYTVVYSNSGNMTASGVWITDTLDSNVSFGGSNPAPTGGSGDSWGWYTATLSPSDNYAIVVTVTVDSPLPSGTVLTNTADITCSERISGTTGPVTSTVVSTPTLHITKTDAPDPVNAGGVLTYTVVYSNSGNMTASGVWITDTFDGNVSFGGSNPAPTGGSGDSWGWYTATLSPSDNYAIVITVTVDSPLPDSTVLTNTADIICSEGVSGTTGSVATTVWSADLAITKTVTPTTSLQPEDWLTYTLAFSNQGHITATGVVITDIYQPISLTNVISISSGATVTPTAATPPTYTWDVQDLSSGQSGVITITAQVTSTQTGVWSTVLTNTAYITTTQPDGDGTNDTDQVSSVLRSGDVYYLPIVAKDWDGTLGSRPSGLEPRPTLPPQNEPVVTITPTLIPTSAPRATPSLPASTPTPSPTPVPTVTPSATPEVGGTDTPTPATTLGPTSSPTPAPTATLSATPEVGGTDMPTPATTLGPTSPPTPAATATLSATPEVGGTDTPTATSSSVPTPAATLPPEVTDTPTPTSMSTSASPSTRPA